MACHSRKAIFCKKTEVWGREGSSGQGSTITKNNQLPINIMLVEHVWGWSILLQLMSEFRQTECLNAK